MLTAPRAWPSLSADCGSAIDEGLFDRRFARRVLADQLGEAGQNVSQTLGQGHDQDPVSMAAGESEGLICPPFQRADEAQPRCARNAGSTPRIRIKPPAMALL